MSYLKFLLNFFKYLVIINPFKILLLILSIISYQFIDTFQGEWEKYDVVATGKHGNDFIYVIQVDYKDDGYDVIKSETEKNIKEGQISIWDYNDVNILFWILFIVPLIVLCIGTIIGVIHDDDDVSWELKKCYVKSLTTLVYCELEDGIYYYMVMGRLICKKDKIIHGYHISNLGVNSFSEIYRLPKFSTKTMKRENNLQKLGIK
jgi:hypothetical protein